MEGIDSQLLEVQLLVYYFCSKLHLYYVGDYQDDLRIGNWKYIYDNRVIGGGFYEKGLKKNKWIDFSQEFQTVQLLFSGIYKNNKKIGRWDITFMDGLLIGGGPYDQKGMKNGKWVDLGSNFNEANVITYNGKYEQGKKTGFWNIIYYDQQIGGGSYDKEGIKIGEWIELIDEFKQYLFVLFKGRYNQGIKVGDWDINWVSGLKLLIKVVEDIMTIKVQNVANGLSWVINLLVVVKYCMKVYTQIIQKLGDGNSIMKGNKLMEDITMNWVKKTVIGQILVMILIGIFYLRTILYFSSCQVIYKGEYKKGVKIGQWNIYIEEQYLGFGSYNEEGIKIGKWVDTDYMFDGDNYVAYYGEYKNNKKIGMWITQYKYQKNPWQQIGCGLFNEKGQKSGKWIDLCEDFSNFNKFNLKVQYKDGIKIGK